MSHPGWSKPWEEQLVEETEAYLRARANHPSNFQREDDEEIQPHGEYPDLH